MKACFLLNFLLNICPFLSTLAVAVAVVVVHSLRAILERVDKTEQGSELLLANSTDSLCFGSCLCIVKWRYAYTPTCRHCGEILPAFSAQSNLCANF